MTHKILRGLMASGWLVTAVPAVGGPRLVADSTSERAVSTEQHSRGARKAVPPAVQNVLERAERCEHLAGELNGDRSVRDREVNRELVRAKCERIPAEIEALRVQYKGDASIVERLARYE